jgi:hypothetical protein
MSHQDEVKKVETYDINYSESIAKQDPIGLAGALVTEAFHIISENFNQPISKKEKNMLRMRLFSGGNDYSDSTIRKYCVNEEGYLYFSAMLISRLRLLNDFNVFNNSTEVAVADQSLDIASINKDLLEKFSSYMAMGLSPEGVAGCGAMTSSIIAFKAGASREAITDHLLQTIEYILADA